jgi:ketosteroid isomerase-like protein
MPPVVKRHIAALLLGLAVAGAAACASAGRSASAPELSPERAAAVVSGVQATLDAYRKLAAAGRWDALMRLYADDPRFRWVANGAVEARSVAEIRQHFFALAPEARVETTFEDTEIAALSPDLARVVTRFKTRVVDPYAGGFSFGGILTTTLVRLPDGWKILDGHSSSPSRQH